MVSLADCAAGVRVLVRHILDESYGVRLRELGIGEGMELRVLRGPDPLLLHVRESRLALGRELARRIWVEPIQLEEVVRP
jgi:Fe2+ transport system protein FeoA|nr:MAG: hypothetical protein KatS3mg041_0040 [Bacteroidota bacterium]